MITTKQRAELRSLANKIEPILHIGKNGVTENTVMQAEEALLARELVKGTVQENCGLTAKEVLRDMCEKTGAVPVQYIGRKFVFYRQSENKKYDI